MIAAVPDDAEVISASTTDPERFTELYRRYAADIHRYVASRLGPDTADDLMVETFLQAFRHRHRYDPARAAVRPWLYGIATKLISRQRRSELRIYRAIARTGIDPAVESPIESATDRLSAEGSARPCETSTARLRLPPVRGQVLPEGRVRARTG
ncbi:RNA polymerase subunit sigma-70 [Actinoallomurus spadix]|uniref:RNA polymerase sigma-70 region 2 domain-containing protein n=1 Tax=Actinoallomurus spadix TaxID=79912 RepID=A0ABN0WEA7_9ACTN|nr:sigma factor [Actinoallomurus spadix]MCO5987231.1 RNA polymerase subunit sigma-70 [Actinoallomurus spadix]